MEDSGAPLEAEETGFSGPVVRYKGTADARWVYLSDLQGAETRSPEYHSWDAGNNHSIPWSVFLESCGSEDRALAFLSANDYDFELVGLDVELPGAEEFEIGGVE